MNYSFSFLWHGTEWWKKFEDGVTKRLEAAAIHLENKIKEKLSTKCPAWKDPNASHSPPGGYPFLESGELRRSITHEVDRTKIVARVGTNKVYGRYLEKGTNKMKAHPFLDPTLKAEWPTIKRLLTGKKIL